MDIMVIIGAIKVLQLVRQLLACLWRHTVRPYYQGKNRIYNNYGVSINLLGNNTWAVVTGGSDGIGLAMCKKLAKEGFNICIVSRSRSKINEKLEEIKKECRDGDSSFKTQCIVADFCEMRTLNEYRKMIANKLHDLDVGVLVLNAGY